MGQLQQTILMLSQPRATHPLPIPKETSKPTMKGKTQNGTGYLKKTADFKQQLFNEGGPTVEAMEVCGLLLAERITIMEGVDTEPDPRE